MTAHACDVLLVTHTGIPWQRRLGDGRLVVNVGAIGRPANDGRTEVLYAITIDTKMPLLGMMKRKAEKVILDTALKELKKRVEG